MQSQKKCRKDKTETMNAQEFATTWMINIGSVATAIAKAKEHEKYAKQASLNPHLPQEELKEYKNTFNFWSNVRGILEKYQKMSKMPKSN